MRNAAFIVLLALGILCPRPGFAVPMQGQVLKADPQLLQTWWTSLAVRDGVRERDAVRVDRNGQKIAEGLVVSVQGDHSSIMLKGTNVPDLQKGDTVTLIHQAVSIAQPATKVATTGYKIVGGHTLVSMTSSTGFTNSMTLPEVGLPDISINPNLSATTFTITTGGFSSNLGITSGLGLSNSLGGSTFSISPTTFSSSLPGF